MIYPIHTISYYTLMCPGYGLHDWVRIPAEMGISLHRHAQTSSGAQSPIQCISK